MNSNSAKPADIDEHLVAVLDEYLAELQAGNAVDKQQWLAKHPEFADDLEACLASLEFVQTAAVTPLPIGPGAAENLVISTKSNALGDYRIVREIGRGGMGVVYEAEQVSLGRRVALKVLPLAAMLDPKQLARFKNEAHAAAQLHHSNIVPVFAVGCERGVHYYAMQYVEGQTLASVIRQLREMPNGANGPNSTISGFSTGDSSNAVANFRTIANLAIQLANALEHAHQVGVIHRDIKPSNLLLESSGQAWVTDFGLAQLETDVGLTLTGDVLGTLRYMSPEQASGNTAVLDHRCDIYSLGVTLYELLTLEPAFAGDDRQALLRKIAGEDPIPPRRTNKSIPTELETIVMKAVAKEPAHRYATAQDLADDLHRFLDDKPIRARRPTWWQRSSKWARRHRGVVITGIVSFALLLITTTVLASLAALWLGQERDAAQAATRDTKTLLFETYLAESQASRTGNGPGRGSLDAVSRASELASALRLGDAAKLRVRNEAIACMAVSGDLRVAQPAWNCAASTWGVDFDQKLKHYAVQDDSVGKIAVRRVDDHQTVAELPALDSGSAMFQFSPDGRHLMVRYASSIYKLWDWRQEKVLAQMEIPPFYFSCAFRPNGETVALVEKDLSLHLYDVSSGNEIKSIQLGYQPEHLCFHPQQNLVAVATGARVECWDLKTEEKVNEFPYPTRVRRLAWSPNGKSLAAVCDDYRVYVSDVSSGQQIAILGGANLGGQIAFSPKGDLLATQTYSGQTILWDPRNGERLVSAPGRFVRFSEDGNRLGFTMVSAVGIWEVSSVGAYYRAWHDRNRDGPFAVAFDSSNRLLAFGGIEGVTLCDSTTGDELAKLRIGRSYATAFLADGELISSGTEGMFRWPINQGDGHLKIGPPQQLDGPVDVRYPHACVDSRGRLVARAIASNRVLLLDLETGTRKHLIGHRDVAHVALSPGGEFAVTGAWHGSGVWLWNTKSGKQLKDLWPGHGPSRSAFSPDGKSLLVSRGLECRLFNVSDWHVIWRSPRVGTTDAPGSIAFSPDGNLVALRSSGEGLRLVEFKTGSELATLHAPADSHSGWASFNGDGTMLAESRRNLVGLWDLGRIRNRLANIQLDWDAPALPATTRRDPRTTAVEVDYGRFNLLTDRYSPRFILASGFAANRKFDQAIESYQQLLEQTPSHAPACNGLAWLLVMGPNHLRDAENAVELAERAVQLAPENSNYLNTLGVTYYRRGLYRKSIATLESSCARSSGGTAYDLFFLAMNHHELGELEISRDCYDRAIAWWNARTTLPATWTEELTTLRAETEAVLGFTRQD